MVVLAFEASSFTSSFMILTILGDGYKIYIVTGFMGKADSIFIAYTLQCGPVLH